MYKFKYTIWDENRFPGFREALSNLYDKSLNHYLDTSEAEDYELEMFDTFFNDFEKHYARLVTSGLVTKKNYNNVLNQFKNIDLVVLLPKTKRNLYGVTLGHQIAINPQISSKGNYDKKFMNQLCVSHELGHIVNNKWTKDVKKLAKRLYSNPIVSNCLEKIGLDNYKYLEFGFSLLDEVVAEESSEEVVHKIYKMKRPSKELRQDKQIFNYNPYLTNYILYGELQDLALNFSKSLNYIKDTRNVSDKEVLQRLVRRSFDEDFLVEIEKELVNSDPKKLEKIVTMLGCMGKIKAATYEVVGLNKTKENISVNKYVDIFNSVKRR